MGKSHYRQIFDLDKKKQISGKNLLKVVTFHNLVEKCCNVWKIYNLTKFANFLIVLRAEIVTTFGSKMITIFRRDTKHKKSELCKAIFSVFCDISPPNFGILPLLKGAFQEFRVFLSEFA